jgi:two-component sensor histidine kinase
MTSDAILMTSLSTGSLHLALEWCACILLAVSLALRRRGRQPAPAQEDGFELREAALQNRAKTLESLLREVNHRVKNNFASLIGLLQMKQEFAHHPREVFQLKDMEIKLSSLANVHHMLSGNGGQLVNLEELCRTLIRTSVALAGSPCQFNVTASPPDLAIRPALVHPLTLVIHELASNAIKHARGPGAPLAINLTLREQDSSIHLDFEDNGAGFPRHILDRFPNTSTGGIQIIQELITSALGGTLCLANARGATARISFPL